MTETDNTQNRVFHQTNETPPAMTPVENFKSRLTDWQGWLNLLLLFLVLEIAVFSIERARWINPQPSLTMVLGISVLVVRVLVMSRFRAVLIHVLALVVGGLVTIWQGSSLIASTGAASGFSGLFSSLGSSFQTTATSNPGEKTIIFALFLAFLTWVTGYISTWFILRKQNPWFAVCLGGLILLVNLSNLPDRYYFIFGLYFFAAVLLVVQTRIYGHRSVSGHGAGYQRREWLYLTVLLLCVVVLATTFAWILPQARVPQLQTLIATKILWKKDLEESRFNFFNAVPVKQDISTNMMLREIQFQKLWHDGDNIEFIIRSERPSYWQVQVYDKYTSRGWENSKVTDYFLEQDSTWSGTAAYLGREEFSYTVEPEIKTDILLTAGDFISSNTPALVHMSAGDVIAVRAPRLLNHGETYSMTASVPVDIPGGVWDLSDYPQSIIDNYLQLPSDFPERIRRKSQELIGDVEMPYQKVLAIDEYLSRIPYNIEVPAPPAGTDGIEYFLFNEKSGYCLYFASAMAVMLRSVNVPARLVVGYLPGEPGDEVGKYILRDKHYHAWTQAFFPGYGWINLEATPGGEQSEESEVEIETPWISGDAIDNLSYWESWMEIYDTPGFYGAPGEETTPGVSEQPQLRSGRLSFADELGRALVIIFGIAALIAIIIFPLLGIRKSFFYRLWHVERPLLATSTYSKMSTLAAMNNMGPRPQQTPSEFAAKLASSFPLEADDINKIASVYIENRFGHRGRLGLFEEAELLKSRRRVYDAILKRLGFTGIILRRRRY